MCLDAPWCALDAPWVTLDAPWVTLDAPFQLCTSSQDCRVCWEGRVGWEDKMQSLFQQSGFRRGHLQQVSPDNILRLFHSAGTQNQKNRGTNDSLCYFQKICRYRFIVLRILFIVSLFHFIFKLAVASPLSLMTAPNFSQRSATKYLHRQLY